MQATKDRIILEIDKQEVLRDIGYEPTHTVPPRATAIVEDYLQNFEHLIDPSFYHAVKEVYWVQGVYSFLQGGIALKSNVIARLLERCEQVCFFAITIGPYMEEVVLNLTERKQVLQARVLDAIGSIAAEKMADYVQESVRLEVGMKGQSVSRCFCPGHCDWPIEDQRNVFPLLDVPRREIELTEHCLMLPRKSLCGLFGIGREAVVGAYDPCVTCAQKDCHGRRYSLESCKRD
jgi:hypothetical protein